MMNIEIQHGVMYVDQVRFSFVGAGDGRNDIQPGSYPVEARYSHNHGKTLPHADGLGWLGFTPDCAIIVGKVRAGNGLIPSSDMVQRLLLVIETYEETGRGAVLEVK